MGEQGTSAPQYTGPAFTATGQPVQRHTEVQVHHERVEPLTDDQVIRLNAVRLAADLGSRFIDLGEGENRKRPTVEDVVGAAATIEDYIRGGDR